MDDLLTRVLERVGFALVAGAIEAGRALAGKVDPSDVKRKADQYLADNASALAAAEERERRSFSNR